MTQIAIDAEDISKLYRLEHGSTSPGTFRELVTNLALAPIRRLRKLQGSDQSLEDFWALQDISFQVPQGQVVGIIGRNGAGKSTLLKILSRIVEPSPGPSLDARPGGSLARGRHRLPPRVERPRKHLSQRIHPRHEKREIDRRFDEIVAFAEVEKFLDTPVKRYCSGMYVRLAFAVAAHLEPEILIVDEVLAVGDAEFQKKCLGKMREVSTGEGRTVLFVSHNMGAVTTLCDRAMLLDRGRLVADGPPPAVVDRYLIPATENMTGSYDLRSTAARAESYKQPIIVGARVLDESMRPTKTALPSQMMRIEVDLEPSTPMRSPMVGIGFDNFRGERIFVVGSHISPTPLDRADGPITVAVTFRMPPLFPGNYEFEISIMPVSGRFVDYVAPAGTIEVLHDNCLETSYPYFSEMGSVLVPSRWETVRQPMKKHAA